MTRAASEIADVARKYRRALRNETGVRFTLPELRALANIGTLEALQIAEAKELTAQWPANIPPMSSGNSGLTSAATERPRLSGKSPGMTTPATPSAIAALVAAS